jgi:alkylation response protein AidB-like acyl-CoA dehydrogenase
MSDLDIDRGELRTAVRDLLDDASTSAKVRALAETADGFDADLWRHFVEMGLPGIEIGEEHDGAGAAFGDLAVVLVELGRHLTGTGLAATTVLGAGGLLAAPESAVAAEWLPRIAAGEARATAAVLGADGDVTTAGFMATREGDDWVLSGTAACVADAAAADVLVLRARAGEGSDLLVAVEAGTPGLTLAPAPMLDITRRFADVTANDLRVPPSGLVAAGETASRAVTRLLDRAELAAACDALGAAERGLQLTVDYAKTRVQFDREIGSFQAVKHRCTDMYIAVETARIALQDGLDRYDADPDQASAAASRAKAYCCDAAAQVVEDGVDLHGGIGFTWEHDMHLLVKRARLDQALYGDSRLHRRRVADLSLPKTGATAATA